MPGLNQLKQFTEDIREVGDEVKIRAQRGEKTPEITLPQGISEEDDSNDFIIGMPDKDAVPENVPSEEDVDAQIEEILGGNVAGLDSILEPQLSADDADLSEFLSDDTLSSPTEEVASLDEAPEAATEETPLEDMDLDSLLQPSSSAEEINLNEDIPPSVLENDGVPPAQESAIDDFSMDAPVFDEEPSPEKSEAPEELSSDLLSESAPVDDISAFPDSSTADPLADMGDLSAPDSNLDLGGFDIDSLINGDDSGNSEDDSLTDAALAALNSSGSSSASPDIAESPEPVADIAVSDDLSDSNGFDNLEEPSAGEGLSDLGDINLDGFGEVPDASDDVPDATFDSPSSESDNMPLESFDTSGMEDVDFGPTEPSSIGDEFPATGENLSDDDFELDSSFEIPGFSDTETADFGKKKSFIDTVDFSKGKEGLPKNALTDEEYIQFKKNLAGYPLNLRIALEDFIARDEFTDDAVFEIIEKVLKKTSARQLATQLEKILDISINIPRDFERRSYAEYEAYKQSFQYQLKNRIIPAAIVGIVLCFVCFGLFKAGQHFIYKPVMANINYKQGYTLLEANEFPQSEEKFKTAVSYKPVKKWFFKYALGYRNKKQFDRAGQMYKNTLRFFNQDKQAGLDYAEMELYDRANYERAEEIVRREVLDYHINDADGILMLGDVFLEWAEVDESKYELAKAQYLDLLQRYGSNNVYLSRMLRYNIRTDKLREVLTYKNMFYVSKQDKQNLKNLGSADWTELSGYLLDKLYGPLSKNDEYLRSSIEDVLAMLNLAIKSDPANPVGRYNLARYYIRNGNTEQAKTELERSLELFGNIPVRTKKNVYREINASRVLGELYADTREYLKAQTVYTRGINLYNEEHEASELEGDENTGKLFADMGDLDYFISGDMDDALYNYERAIEIKNDTPSINFRVGSIYYGRKDFDSALVSFLKVSEKEPKDPNLLLSLGNVLSIRGDNFAAESYYSDLLRELDKEREKRNYFQPQEDADDYIAVDLYLKANNNLGVTLYRIAQQTGNSGMNAEAMVRLSDSIRAWDSLTRNPDTMIRMEGSNLAAQNTKYITHPHPDFEPAIYTDIPRLLTGEKGFDK